MTLRSGHPPRLVAVLAFPGVRLLDVTGPLEVFSAPPLPTHAYACAVYSPEGGQITTHAGVSLDTISTSQLPLEIDTLVVPGAPDWLAAINMETLVATVTDLAGRSRRVASVCAGAFVLAATGLLDGQTSATHWGLSEELAKQFPKVTVDRDAIFVRSGRFYSSAGVSSGMDLSLALVEEDLGASVARDVARDLVVFMQRPGGQAQFSARMNVPATDVRPLRDLLDSVVADPSGDHRLPALSERAGFSERHLSRLFRSELGMTPARYVELVRIEAARGLLEQTQLALSSVAQLSGLGSAETLRRTFARDLGVAPADYRRRFSAVAARV